MEKSNTLIWNASSEVSDADNNRDQIILVLRQLHQIASTVIASPNPVEEWIWEYSEKEAEVVAALKRMKRTGPHKLANEVAEWKESDKLVYYRGKLYVLNNVKIHHEILKQYHDSVTTKHLDCNLTLELVKCHY